MTAPRLLVVQHEGPCPPGWMGEWLTDAGCDLDVRRPYAGDSLPPTLDEHGGMVVLGGSMDAYADARFPWLTDVKRLVRRAADEEVPVLGICLGHQLAAVALGGEVIRNPRGQQMGVVPFGWTAAAGSDPLLGPVADAGAAVQWNDDIVVSTPPGSVTLAATPAGELQAARFAPTVWGVQSHPEAGADIVAVWAEKDRGEASARGVDVDVYVEQVAAARDELRSSWAPLAGALTAVCHDATRRQEAPSR